MRRIDKMSRWVWRGMKSFARFWRDFLIGETPEIALGVVVILGLAFLVSHSPIAVELTIGVLAILLLAASVLRRARNR